jgi:hypothetical protein
MVDEVVGDGETGRTAHQLEIATFAAGGSDHFNGLSADARARIGLGRGAGAGLELHEQFIADEVHCRSRLLRAAGG